MSELDLANHDGSSGEEGGSPRPATRGGWEGGHALSQPSGGAAAAGAAGVVGGGAAAEEGGKPPVDETADKLDSLMELTFGHLQRRAEAGQGGAAWDTLLAAFERCVLLTHRSKFTQVGLGGMRGWHRGWAVQAVCGHAVHAAGAGGRSGRARRG